MEIRFCDRCSESIPDVDFDAGKAVTVDGRHYHAACALTKSLSIGGPRSWLTFLLALYAAGVGTWLLVRARPWEAQPPPVPSAVRQAIEEHVGRAESRTAAKITEARQQAVSSARLHAVTTTRTLGEELLPQLDALRGRQEESEGLASEHVTAQRKRLEAVEKEVGALNTLLREVREQADRLEAQRAAASARPPGPSEPVAPPKAEPEPAPTRPPEPPESGQDEEVDRWIRRLRDPNENIRFTATLQLGLLKSLSAVEPLVKALKEDRDYYVRLGAATALGDIRAVNAIPTLVDALEDDDALVRTAANDALQAITEQPYEFVPGMSRSERRRLQKRWRDWFGENERALRDRLGQPM